MHILNIEAPSKNYPLFIGPHALEKNASLFHGKRCFVVTDAHLHALYKDAIKAYINPVATHVLPVGETAKQFAEIEKTLNWLLQHALQRTDVVVALGGGVVGDHAGFAASIALRGVPFIQVPTTLLAQVDSSIGGKTGVNSQQGKNLIGSFYQPEAVVADTHFLTTLPVRERKAGYAEIIKAALLYDRSFFEALNSKNVLEDAASWPEIIRRACEIKADIVAQDEHETKGQRALLNLGHTFAHVLEWACGYDNRVLHGEAVSIGLCLAAQLSEKIGFAEEAVYEPVVHHLKTRGMPICIADITGWPSEVAADALYNRMAYDKKAQNGTINFVLLRKIGKAEQIKEPVEKQHVLACLQESLCAG